MHNIKNLVHRVAPVGLATLTTLTTLGIGLFHGPSLALPVTITTPFINLENDGVNSSGFSVGQFFRVGANAISPNGAAGTTVTSSTVNTVNGQTVTRNVSFSPSPLLPNFYSSKYAINTALLGAYTLTATNGTNTASSVLQLPVGTAIAPFVQSISLAGTAANPTFTWSPPPATTVNGYRINIYDDAIRVGNNSGQVASINVAPTVTSHTVTAADFTVPGYGLTLGKNYTIEIGLIQTRDGTSTNLGNENLASISRSYANFSPTLGGGPPVNLPVVLSNGSFQFNVAVVPGVTYYIDPPVATGYDYQIGAGDPNFKTVTLPTGVSGTFNLLRKDSNGNLVFVTALVGGQTYDFGVGGVSFFEVTGIDPAANLNPLNTTAFVTALTFTGSGVFSGTQTPIVFNTGNVPLPASILLLGIGFIGIVRSRKARG
jgi:hypothetical protein